MMVAKPDPCCLYTVAVAYVGEVQAALQQGSPDASLLQACTVDVAVAHLNPVQRAIACCRACPRCMLTRNRPLYSFCSLVMQPF